MADAADDAAIEALGKLVRMAYDPKTNVEPYPCHLKRRYENNAITPDACLDRRCNGCYCHEFELWRGDEPVEVGPVCEHHKEMPPLWRRGFLGGEWGEFEGDAPIKCWWCTLEYHEERYSEYGNGQNAGTVEELLDDHFNNAEEFARSQGCGNSSDCG